MRPAASNRDLVIRPLGLGEIIDWAIALTRRHFRPLFLWMLLIEAPAVAVSRIQLAGLGDVVASLHDAAAAEAALRHLARGSIVSLAGLLLLQAVATAICAAVVAPSLIGRAPAPSALRRAAAIATAAPASLALLLGVPAVASAPGLLVLMRAESPAGWAAGVLLLAVGVAFGLLATILRTLLVPAVAAIEGRPHFAAVGRSIALMRAPRGMPFLARPAVRASLVLLAAFALALAVNVLVGAPRGIAGRLAGGSPLLPAALPLWAEIPLLLFEAAATAALQPFSLVAVVVLYFDRRARREGIDLERFADQLERGAGS